MRIYEGDKGLDRS